MEENYKQMFWFLPDKPTDLEPQYDKEAHERTIKASEGMDLYCHLRRVYATNSK